MNAEWHTRRLGNIATVVMGQSPSSGYYNTHGDGLAFFQGSGQFGELHPSPDKYCSRPIKVAQPGDVLMSVRAPIGALNIADRECCIGRGLCAIRPHEKGRFVYYLLKANADLIQTYGSGTTFKAIAKAEVSNLPLVLPRTQKTQRTIAAILSAYDDLIENNLRRIEILEEMAQLIYHEWFVKFRFPGHEKVPMVESPLGKIAQGWEVGRLEDALVLQRGFDLPTKKRRDGIIPVYAATGIVGTHNQAKIKGPGVVTGRSGSLGTVRYVHDDYWPLNTTLWVKDFRRSTPLHAYYLLSGLNLQRYDSGAAVPTLNRNDIHGLPVVLPPDPLLRLFDEQVVPIYELIKILDLQKHDLSRARDLLLPRLVSGQLDVAGIEVD